MSPPGLLLRPSVTPVTPTWPWQYSWGLQCLQGCLETEKTSHDKRKFNSLSWNHMSWILSCVTFSKLLISNSYLEVRGQTTESIFCWNTEGARNYTHTGSEQQMFSWFRGPRIRAPCAKYFTDLFSPTNERPKFLQLTSQKRDLVKCEGGVCPKSRFLKILCIEKENEKIRKTMEIKINVNYLVKICLTPGTLAITCTHTHKTYVTTYICIFSNSHYNIYLIESY